MAIEILLEGNLKPVSDQEKFTAFLQHFCHHKQLKCEDYGNLVVMEVCPEGMIECSYENDFISILAQTNIAGPGFHAYAAQLLTELMEESDVELEASDPTGYMQERNFENLKYDYFYKWLASIAEYVNENEQLEHLCISWPLHYYRPQPKANCVVTPMGYIRMDDFRNKEVEELAEQFFIWNEQGRTAKFYRSCALNLIWKEGYFEYSNMNEYTYKTAGAIMDYLEIAHELDAELPLPLSAYSLISHAIAREHLLKDAASMDDKDFGYRKNTIQFELGNWVLPVDGFSEIYQDQERGSAQIISAYHQEDEAWTWMLQADVQDSGEFERIFFEDSAFIIEKKEIKHDTVYGYSLLLNYGEHYELFAQLQAEAEQLLLRFRTTDKKYLDAGNAILEHIQHYRVDHDDAVKH